MTYCGCASNPIGGVAELGRTSSATGVRRLATVTGYTILATVPSTLAAT